MMPRHSRWLFGLAALCVAVACGDRATEPTFHDAPAAARSSSGTDVVRLLKRDAAVPLLSVSAVIGPRGGRLEIKRAGVTIDFPRGALGAPTPITVTALRGRNVAYLFEPHGIVFAAPVTIRQSLMHTAAWSDPELAAGLQGSYFERLLVDPTEVFARSLERRPGKLEDSGLRRYLEFTIEHFSGYAISVGKSGVEVDVDIDITGR
jgi:hypothetical protein